MDKLDIYMLLKDCVAAKKIGNAQYEFQLFENALSNLIVLDLSYCKCCPEDSKVIAEALKINNTITTLNLYKNAIGLDGAKDIAKALKINKSISILNLFSNAIGNQGAKYISETLKSNKAIIKLDLCNNAIGDEGAKAIAESLKTNTSITCLDLSYNTISNEGAEAIAESLKSNISITKLDLTENHISEENAKKIKIKITENKQLSESLIEAAINNDLQKAIEALQKGANINHQDDAGNTALHHAINQASHAIINLLVDLPHQHNNLKNNNGITAADSHLLPREGFKFSKHGINFFSRLTSDVSKQGPTAPDVTFKFQA